MFFLQYTGCCVCCPPWCCWIIVIVVIVIMMIINIIVGTILRHYYEKHDGENYHIIIYLHIYCTYVCTYTRTYVLVTILSIKFHCSTFQSTMYVHIYNQELKSHVGACNLHCPLSTITIQITKYFQYKESKIFLLFEAVYGLRVMTK